ncbi:MAG: metallophosphoesterase, partial [Candidatus Lindowbacteria bacterium]|nr:metallophosphoesterase [Candidatus Lindowbacteria bacterium]
MVSSSLGFRVQNLVFHHPDLPDEFENIRALFVADIHPRRDEVAKRLYTFLKDRSYDLVLFGGDYQCGLSPITLECYKELLKVINAPKSRMGSFGCLGNHDSDDLISYLGEDTDVVFEENASVEIAPNFHISMLGDAWDRKDKPAITTANIPANTFNLCLSHSPDTAHEASAHGVSIQLSGHTHGGQIVMPLVGAL